MSNCFKQMSDLSQRVCNLLDTGWQDGQSEWESERDTDKKRQKESKSINETDIHILHSLPQSPVLLLLLSVLFTLGCEDCLIMAGLSAPGPF